jgi:hypothetical protein
MKATQKLVALTTVVSLLLGGAIAGCTSTITTTPLPGASSGIGETGTPDGSNIPPILVQDKNL